MRWESALENLESDIEHKSEKELEQSTKYNLNTEVRTKEDLYDKIKTLLSTCETLKTLQDIGEDISDSITIINNNLEELLRLGEEKSLLSVQERQNIKKQVQKSLGKKEETKTWRESLRVSDSRVLNNNDKSTSSRTPQEDKAKDDDFTR